MHEEVKKYMSSLGKKRFKNMSPEEISKYMSEVRTKGIENKKRVADTDIKI